MQMNKVGSPVLPELKAQKLFVDRSPVLNLMYAAGATYRPLGLNPKPLVLVERGWFLELRPNTLSVGLSVVRGQEWQSLLDVL